MVKKNNFVPVQDLAGNIIMVEPDKKKRGRPPKKPVEENITMVINEIKKRGRPKKYSTAEEARKAKIANTIASAKKRKEKQGKGVFLDHIKSIFTGTAEPSEYVIFVLAKVALFLLHKKSKKILKERYGIEGTWFPILKLLAEGTKEAYSRAIGQGGANVIRNLGQVVVDNTDLQDDLEQQVEGSGLFSDFNKKIKGVVQAVANTATSVVKKVKDTAIAVVKGRDDYPPKVRDTISKYGDKVITGITLGRTPLGKPLMTALQVASGNTFSQKLENTPYDKLFHLFMCIEFANGKIVLEKNEVINTENSCKIPKDTETKNITSSDIPTGLTLIDALNNTKERMGGKFFTYSAKDNNCQDFIVAFLTANNIGNETDKSWVKQETKVLFEGNDRLRKIANTLTDIGARFDVVRQGAGTKRKKKGGMVDEGYETPPPTIPLTPAQGNSILNAEFGATHQIRLNLLQNAINNIGGGTADVRQRYRNWVSGFSNPQQVNRYLRIFDAILAFEYDGATDVESDEGGKIKGGYVLPYNATWNNYAGNDPMKHIEAQIHNNALVAETNKQVELKKKKEAEDLRKLRGYGNKKSPNNNIGMANKWIEYVKAYAKKNNMKYNEALKDPKCKAGYKSGEGVFDVLKSVGKAVAPVAIDLASQYAKKKISGSGMPTSRDEYISQLYDQANLGANGKVRLN